MTVILIAVAGIALIAGFAYLLARDAPSTDDE